MQEQQQQFNQTQQAKQPTPAGKPSTTSINDEYIDFEEVKDWYIQQAYASNNFWISNFFTCIKINYKIM